MSDREKINQTRIHMTQMTQDLCAKFGPIETLGLYVGQVYALLDVCYGKEKACQYIRALADEIEANPDT